MTDIPLDNGACRTISSAASAQGVDTPMKPRTGPNPKGYASPEFDLRARLKKLGIKQVHFADLINRDHSGLRRWCAHSPQAPMEVELLVDLLDHLLDGRPEPDWLRTLKGEGEEDEEDEAA